MSVKFMITGILAAVAGVQAWMGIRVEPVGILPERLSELHIFEGRPSDLRPSGAFKVYELATTLFTDYAEKQRFMKLPPGSHLPATGNGLPLFPEGTMLVKTFFYYTDKKDTAKGKQIIETRVMVLSGGQWVWGTYLWDLGQTEALLMTGKNSSHIKIDWLDEQGASRRIRYVVPSHTDCATCHNSAGKFMPIGPTFRNLRMGATHVPSLPAWQDSSYAVEQRARAYLDVNCAHCHNPDGSCSKAGMDLRYEAALPDRRMFRKVAKNMRTGRMPLIGTTIVHQEGLALIEEYNKSLKK